MISEEIVFLNENRRLAGTLYEPESKPLYPALVAVHPASGGERTDAFYEHLKTELPRRGIAVCIFDRRGSGSSEGDFETADFEDLAALRLTRDPCGDARCTSAEDPETVKLL